MASGRISSERVLARLDEHLGRNDYESARKHLLYWLDEARSVEDFKAEILILNELMGLFRKLGERDLALEHASLAMQRLTELGIENQVGAGTTYLTCATVFKAFGMPQRNSPDCSSKRISLHSA